MISDYSNHRQDKQRHYSDAVAVNDRSNSWFTSMSFISTIFVGICSGVTSAGIVISSAFGGTSSRKSSLTNDKMSDV